MTTKQIRDYMEENNIRQFDSRGLPILVAETPEDKMEVMAYRERLRLRQQVMMEQFRAALKRAGDDASAKRELTLSMLKEQMRNLVQEYGADDPARLMNDFRQVAKAWGEEVEEMDLHLTPETAERLGKQLMAEVVDEFDASAERLLGDLGPRAGGAAVVPPEGVTAPAPAAGIVGAESKVRLSPPATEEERAAYAKAAAILRAGGQEPPSMEEYIARRRRMMKK